MTDKELRRMGRRELIELLSLYQRIQQQQAEEIAALQAALLDRSIKIENLGSIAEAALALNDVFDAAQKAADQYLAEARQCQKRIIQQAQRDATAIREQAAFDHQK